MALQATKMREKLQMTVIAAQCRVVAALRKTSGEDGKKASGCCLMPPFNDAFHGRRKLHNNQLPCLTALIDEVRTFDMSFLQLNEVYEGDTSAKETEIEEISREHEFGVICEVEMKKAL